MKAIKNTGVLSICNNCDATLTAGATYSFVASTKILTVTEASTFGSGDGLKACNVLVFDKFGNKKAATITTAAAAATIDLSSGMDLSLGFNISVAIVTNKRVVSDLATYGIMSGANLSGALGFANNEGDTNGPGLDS